MCDHSHCDVRVSSVHQTLEELEFERGIWSAALDGNVEKVQNFLGKGLDPSVHDSSGYTPLHYAARNGHKEVCQVLLSWKASPNAQTPGGATPLHRAALQGHVDIVSLLLKHGAEPSISDSDGKTPLHKAAEGQHFSVASVLLKACSNLKQCCDNRGLTPSNYVDNKNTSLLNLLS